jgi:hypothetical protein
MKPINYFISFAKHHCNYFHWFTKQEKHGNTNCLCNCALIFLCSIQENKVYKRHFLLVCSSSSKCNIEIFLSRISRRLHHFCSSLNTIDAFTVVAIKKLSQSCQQHPASTNKNAELDCVIGCIIFILSRFSHTFVDCSSSCNSICGSATNKAPNETKHQSDRLHSPPTDSLPKQETKIPGKLHPKSPTRS